MGSNWTKQDLEKHLKKENTKPLFAVEEFTSSTNDENIIIYKNLFENQDKIIYIPGNAPSLKNSKQILQMNTGKTTCCNSSYTKLASYSYKCNKCGEVSTKLGKRPILVPSKLHKEYADTTTSIYQNNTKKFIELVNALPLPIYLGFYFIRKSNHKFDFDNVITTILDIIVKAGYVSDDNANFIVPVVLGWHHDPNNGGVIITPLKERPKISYLWN